jgi:hypothetical protein
MAKSTTRLSIAVPEGSLTLLIPVMDNPPDPLYAPVEVDFSDLVTRHLGREDGAEGLAS